MSSGLLMRDMPGHERPRERLLEKGADALKNSELVAILLRTGVRGASALEVADQLLSRFETLDRLSRASIPELRQTKGVGRDKAIALKSAFTLARRMAEEIRREAPTLDSPERIAELLREENRAYDVEHFQVVLLNTRRKLLSIEKISQGTLDTILVHPREVFKPAIAANAAAIVLAHNHPSGDPTPSAEDVAITKRLVKAGDLLGITVFDHIILGQRMPGRDQDFVSLKELGLM
jgi:DNA repair protein RadC